VSITGKGGGRWSALPLFSFQALLLLALAACGSGGEAAEGGSADLRTGGSIVSAPVSDSLDLRLEFPEQVPQGEPIRITLRIENVSGAPLDLYLRGREVAFDLVVAAEDGQEVWRRLQDAVIPAILRIETLEVSEVLELMHEWDQRSDAGDPVAPGEYLVRGELLTETEPLSPAVGRLRIEPRE
jgi:hypothetical protein